MTEENARPDDDAPHNAVDRALRSTIRDESTAFGFSITITLSFGALQMHHGSPVLGELVLFAAGAVGAFTLLEALLTRGFRKHLPQHHSMVASLGTAMNALSVLGGLGAAVGVADLLNIRAAWLLAPFCAALTYLLLESAEIVVAERIQVARGDPEATQVDE